MPGHSHQGLEIVAGVAHANVEPTVSWTIGREVDG